MKIFVNAKPKAKIEKIKEKDETHFDVWVKEPPAEGKANAAVEKALADYFGIPRSRVQIVSGRSSRAKIIEIL